ncbi:MAG: ATP12 family protein [Pseudomonadota bacterium]
MSESQDGSAQIDPVLAAQLKARVELPKRFYQDVTTAKTDDGHHAVLLDGRSVRTPARNVLALPTQGLAEAVAEEWRAQEVTIDPKTMPLTRLVNSAIDGVADAIQPVAEEIARYAGTDMICYRADAPEGLVALQCQQWDPVIAWLHDALGVRLVLTEGLSHIVQSETALARIAADLSDRSAFQIAALSAVTTLTGSAALALMLDAGVATPDDVWIAAHVDEDWQISLWGEDAEAAARRAFRRMEFDAAALILREFARTG